MYTVSVSNECYVLVDMWVVYYMYVYQLIIKV